MANSAGSQSPSIAVQEIDCPLCGSSDHRMVCVAKDYTYAMPGEYVVVRCCACRHMYLNPRPTDESLMNCYPQNYVPHRFDNESQTASPSKQKGSWLRRIVRAIPGLRRFLFWLGQEHATVLPAPPVPGESRLLEIGCAHGGFLKRASDLGWVVDGIEPGREAAQAAKDQGLDVYCGLFSDRPLASASRDAVILWMVLEHVPNPVELLEEIARILRPGGLLALSVPNAGGWERRLAGRYWLGYDAPRHLQDFTASRVRQLLGAQGFERIRVVHQANTRFWWGSIAAWGVDRLPQAAWPTRWMHYFRTDPPELWRWALLIPGKLVSIFRCSGRITVVANAPTGTASR